ncbi:hypothetical protein J1N35_044363 [Gossypium stocksii]|uniref:Uncharacterized protein n=1 Tax=Gossypium stocksii TaxID=47602 RepID=A0A9D3U991_9ROSI|nr:hypothetical protein J1N35_044363 [Gossypium stocksii]
MDLVPHLLQLWGRLHLSRVIIMDSLVVQQIMRIHHPIRKLLPSMATDMDMKRNMKIIPQFSILMEDMDLLSQDMHSQVLNLGMPLSSNMASHHLMACSHKDPKHMVLQPINLEKYHIKVQLLSHMVQMCLHSSSMHMHQVGQRNKAILHMVLHHLVMGTVSLQLWVARLIRSKVASLFLVTVNQLHMHKQVALLGMVNTHHRNKATLNRHRLLTMQVMGIKGRRILVMVVRLQQHMVHLQPVVKQLMHKQQQLNLPMISLFLNLVVMLQRQVVHLLGMEKQFPPNLDMRSMIPPRCMLHRVDMAVFLYVLLCWLM